MNWIQISEQLRIAKKDRATFATLYRGLAVSSANGSGGVGQNDLYVRKEVECQRRYQKLMTDLVHSSLGNAANEGSSSGGRKRSAAGSGDTKITMSKGPWTAEEDRKVVELVAKYGPKKWSQIAQELPGARECLLFSCSMFVVLFVKFG